VSLVVPDVARVRANYFEVPVASRRFGSGLASMIAD